MAWKLYNPEFEEESIQTFGEGVAPAVKPSEINDAEVETKEQEKEAKDKVEEADAEKEEKEAEVEGDNELEISESEETPASEYTDEELDSMSWEQIRQVRFLPHFRSMEYGTPSGVDNPASRADTCSNCGNADAGDVAIIDAEIAPGDDTDEASPEGDFGAEATEPTEDEGLGMELRAYYQARQAPSIEETLGIPSTEAFDAVKRAIGTTLKFLIIKAAKYARKAYLFARNKISHMFMKLTTIQALWARKLNKNLSKISEERLSEMEIECFPYDVWIDTCKTALEAYNVVDSAERIVFDKSTETKTSLIKSFSQHLEKIGIQLSVGKRRINMDELYDRRTFNSLTGLGFTKSQIPNCIRYLGEIARRIPRPDTNPLEKVMNKCVAKSSAYAAEVNAKLDDGIITRNSQEYKDACDLVMAQTVRIDFCMVTMKTCYTLFDQLVADIEKVFSKYEDALSFKALTD